MTLKSLEVTHYYRFLNTLKLVQPKHQHSYSYPATWCRNSATKSLREYPKCTSRGRRAIPGYCRRSCEVKADLLPRSFRSFFRPVKTTPQAESCTVFFAISTTTINLLQDSNGPFSDWPRSQCERSTWASGTLAAAANLERHVQTANRINHRAAPSPHTLTGFLS